jgi:ADP-ribose pyrophosphatase YjhB (NUDIX family)
VDISRDVDGVKLRVRAVLVDDTDHIVVFRRIRPGREPYYSTPGGGVEPGDRSLADALRRELDEELRAEIGEPVSLLAIDRVHDNGKHNRHLIFGARLLAMSPQEKYGPEFDDPTRGEYELARIPFTPAAIAGLDLHPAQLRDYLEANAATVLGELTP